MSIPYETILENIKKRKLSEEFLFQLKKDRLFSRVDYYSIMFKKSYYDNKKNTQGDSKNELSFYNDGRSSGVFVNYVHEKPSRYNSFQYYDHYYTQSNCYDVEDLGTYSGGSLFILNRYDYTDLKFMKKKQLCKMQYKNKDGKLEGAQVEFNYKNKIELSLYSNDQKKIYAVIDDIENDLIIEENEYKLQAVVSKSGNNSITGTTVLAYKNNEPFGTLFRYDRYNNLRCYKTYIENDTSTEFIEKMKIKYNKYKLVEKCCQFSAEVKKDSNHPTFSLCSRRLELSDDKKYYVYDVARGDSFSFYIVDSNSIPILSIDSNGYSFHGEEIDIGILLA
jgi:hypothetical protein